MSNLIKDLQAKGLISPPDFLPDNLLCLCIAGSESYGVATDLSDKDIVGVCYPRKKDLFPSLYGVVAGYNDTEPFQQYVQHHVQDGDKSYDITVFSLPKYFKLAQEGNPNITDTLFTPRECVIYSTPQYELLRENRHLFLSKLAYPKYKGYAFSELKNINNLKTGKRRELVEKLGYDAKNAGHIFRLLNFIEMILNEHTLDLRRGKEEVKHIRSGALSLEEVKEKFAAREQNLEDVFAKSTLVAKPDYEAIYELLMKLIEMHYGPLSERVQLESKDARKLDLIKQILES
jgi:predicted nucleotidyltransferase